MIKFKAWDKTIERMCEIVTINFEDKWVVYRDWEYGMSYEIPFSDIELLQSTGLKDKHGVEMLEGDVVKTKYGEHGRHIGVVTFRSGKFLSNGVKQYEGYVEELDGAFEIIGNQFEHPHLLKE